MQDSILVHKSRASSEALSPGHTEPLCRYQH